MQTKVEKIVPREDNPKLAGGVVINGQTLPADFVVMGVGVRPATDFLKGSGIEVEKDGGVRVDEYLRVKSGPDTENIYAIGMSKIHENIHAADFASRGHRYLSSASWRRE